MEEVRDTNMGVEVRDMVGENKLVTLVTVTTAVMADMADMEMETRKKRKPLLG